MVVTVVNTITCIFVTLVKILLIWFQRCFQRLSDDFFAMWDMHMELVVARLLEGCTASKTTYVDIFTHRPWVLVSDVFYNISAQARHKSCIESWSTLRLVQLSCLSWNARHEGLARVHILRLVIDTQRVLYLLTYVCALHHCTCWKNSTLCYNLPKFELDFPLSDQILTRSYFGKGFKGFTCGLLRFVVHVPTFLMVGGHISQIFETELWVTES